ncbi:MAG: ABC transporter permease subunit [Acidimicrobiales bacterium]|nr:ABC transporter permease subunit [Acidimicrobiales bacterium]
MTPTRTGVRTRASNRRTSSSARRRVAIAMAAALVWATFEAGVGSEVLNGGGWPSFWRFWRAVISPELSVEFLRLTADAALTTLGFAVLGTALSLLLGAGGALLTSELVAGTGAWQRWWRAVMVIPRAVHEVLWALLLIQVLGFDPLVAVIAIGVPFGAVTTKVFAETIDEADRAPYHALRACGAGRLSALAYGVLPNIAGELTSYAFYRFECAIRSAAVLGVIGAGGLGFQLDLSFESLRYREIWTLVAALMLLSGLADWWSARVRTSTVTSNRYSVLAAVGLIPFSWWIVDLSVSSLWSGRTPRLAADLVADLFPPTTGPGGLGELIDASLATVAMSVLSVAIAAGGALLLGAAAARSRFTTSRRTLRSSLVAPAARLTLLLFRAVPAPVWAFLFVLVLYPGTWPGAVALGVYNLGVVGRLFAETFEEADPHPARRIRASGAPDTSAFLYGTLPVAAPRLASLTLYRWEVMTRETVVVGVVGAGGLGQLINEHLAARDFAAVAGALMAMVVIAVVIDGASSVIRRALR